MQLTLGLTGMDPATETALKAAFAEANDRLGRAWSLVSDSEAAHVVVDMDSMYGPMSWLRLHGAGKTVIACADRPGFIVNRCARPYYGEALALLEEGRSPGEIDAAMVAAGYRLGPFSLMDLVGADINLAAIERALQEGKNSQYKLGCSGVSKGRV